MTGSSWELPAPDISPSGPYGGKQSSIPAQGSSFPVSSVSGSLSQRVSWNGWSHKTFTVTTSFSSQEAVTRKVRNSQEIQASPLEIL